MLDDNKQDIQVMDLKSRVSKSQRYLRKVQKFKDVTSFSNGMQRKNTITGAIRLTAIKPGFSGRLSNMCSL